MALRDEITALFSQGYDAFRADVLGESSALRLFDQDGVLLEVLTTGWLYEDVIEEQTGGRLVELRITDRGDDLSDQEFFGFAGTKYQREGQVHPPTGNPQEWIFNLRPIGIDNLLETFRLIDDAGRHIIDDGGNNVVGLL